MKKILGLDLGTNSIGWALIELEDKKEKKSRILGMGSRIIPMSQDILGEFNKGNSISQTAERTRYRSARRIRERHLLRRERLHRVLNILGFLPDHYSNSIDFKKHFGQFKEGTEPKLAYDGKNFIFKKSFEEMLNDFRKHQPQILIDKKGGPALVPYDWTIYFLRKKALSQKIEKEELAWIILNFNQKRGYYQLRGEEEEENPNKLVEFHSLKIVDVIPDEPQSGKTDIWYSLKLENGWIYRRSSKTPLYDWKEKVRDFIVTTDLNDDGSVKTDKEGSEKRSFRAPGEDDWTLLKKKTEQLIDQSGKTVGSYIYDALLQNPKQKIKGALVRTIERKCYKDELRQILQKQREFHSELQNEELYHECIEELYRNNSAHQLVLSKREIVHLLIEDIIFYQRPLRSQKSSIGNCTLEFYKFKDQEGVEHTRPLKATPKSNPYYQEFRIWQWMHNLTIYKKEDDSNVTVEFLNCGDDWDQLFDFLSNRREIEQKTLLEYFLKLRGFKGKALKIETEKYRWNYVEKPYPCYETRTLIITRLLKTKGIDKHFLTREIEQKLWHLTYSVRDKIEYEKALKSFAAKYNLDENSFVDAFLNFPPFKSEYGSFSEKAIKKLLPLMRRSKHWDWGTIDEKLKDRINKIITGEYDENIKDQVRKKALHLTNETHFQGLPLWLAQYIVYGVPSTDKWNSPNDLEQYLKNFKQHSLRNPIVEQVITETLRVVKDIWIHYGKGQTKFFDEIHVELGREMKNTAEDRKKTTGRLIENENTNLRIKALLAEMMTDPEVENVRPYSPMQQDILKVYEEGVLNSDIEVPDDILKISKTAQPTSSDLQRYKLWLEQKYRSPYTGAIIPLNKLFTPEYEIEHIIPRSLYFDDSFNNKVICESAVNKLKDNQIGLSFIKKHYGEIVPLGFGRTAQIFDIDTYELFVKQHYSKNPGKRNKLLMEDIPEKMIERQMNDTRYISKFISRLLSNVVRANTNDDEINSKNLIPGNGKITSELRQDWGLNDVWNDLILPRFERLNQITNSTDFTSWNEKYKKSLPTVPLELSKGFSKKRIDHRHHALDALVIACATRDHVNLLNNQSAKSETKRYDLQNKLRRKEAYFNERENKQKEAFKEFLKPWETFTQDARNALEHVVVSFKQNQRVINKASNYYEKWIEKEVGIRKDRVKQEGVNWAIRKSMHKGTVSGRVDLPRIKVPKGKLLTATRKPLDTSFDLKAIRSITDTGIQAILERYLKSKDNNPEIAFSPEGIEDLNRNIHQYNGGKSHKPIYKVRIFELGSKFPLGQSGNKITKYVESAQGTNLFFAVYENIESKKRIFDTIPLNHVLEHQKLEESLGVPKSKRTNLPIKRTLEERGKEVEVNFLFSLSPNDLVYMPAPNERIEEIDFQNLSRKQLGRIFTVNDFSNTCYFTPNRLAKNIAPKEVDLRFDASKNKLTGSFDTKTASFEGQQIKDHCIKLSVDRLGDISLAPNISKRIQTPTNILSEPTVAYEKKKWTIRKFDSFEDMENDQLHYFASMKPDERLRNLKKLTMAAYGIRDESELEKPDRKIKPDKTE